MKKPLLDECRTFSVRELLIFAPLGLVVRDEDGDTYSFDGLHYVINEVSPMSATWALFEKDQIPVTSTELIKFCGNDAEFSSVDSEERGIQLMTVIKEPRDYTKVRRR